MSCVGKIIPENSFTHMQIHLLERDRRNKKKHSIVGNKSSILRGTYDPTPYIHKMYHYSIDGNFCMKISVVFYRFIDTDWKIYLFIWVHIIYPFDAIRERVSESKKLLNIIENVYNTNVLWLT